MMTELTLLHEVFKMFKSDSPFVGGVCGGARFSVNQNKTSLKILI